MLGPDVQKAHYAYGSCNGAHCACTLRATLRSCSCRINQTRRAKARAVTRQRFSCACALNRHRASSPHVCIARVPRAWGSEHAGTHLFERGWLLFICITVLI